MSKLRPEQVAYYILSQDSTFMTAVGSHLALYIADQNWDTPYVVLTVQQSDVEGILNGPIQADMTSLEINTTVMPTDLNTLQTVRDRISTLLDDYGPGTVTSGADSLQVTSIIKQSEFIGRLVLPDGTDLGVIQLTQRFNIRSVN
jgi:hypothetical protein